MTYIIKFLCSSLTLYPNHLTLQSITMSRLNAVNVHYAVHEATPAVTVLGPALYTNVLVKT